MSDTSHTFELQYPITHKDVTYKEFTARRPRVSDVRMFYKSVDNDPILATQNVLATLCGVQEAVMSNLDFSDFAVMQKWFQGFFDNEKSE